MRFLQDAHNLTILRYLYGILFGSQLPLWAFPWVMVVPCIVFLPLSFFIADTPLWLVKQVKCMKHRIN